MSPLLSRNLAFLALSCVVSGMTNIVPQRFFSLHTPDDKHAWLAFTLLVGTAASAIGVRAARGLVGVAERHVVAVGVGLGTAVVACLVAGLAVEGVAAFVTMHAVTRLLANAQTQDLDRRAVALAGGAARVENDRLSMMLRFAGMLLGPLCFGLMPATLTASLVLGVVVLSLIQVSVAATAQTVSMDLPSATGSSTAPSSGLGSRGRPIAMAAVAIYGTYYLLASNVVFVLEDVVVVESPARVAGLLITVVYGSAMATMLVASSLLRRGLPLSSMGIAPALMALLGILLGSPLARRAADVDDVIVVAAAVVISVVLGVAFAFFLAALRNHVTREVAAGRDGWLAFFNNVGNTSALAGFSTMALLVGLGRVTDVAFAAILGPGLVGLAAVGMLLLVRGRADRP